MQKSRGGTNCVRQSRHFLKIQRKRELEKRRQEKYRARKKARVEHLEQENIELKKENEKFLKGVEYFKRTLHLPGALFSTAGAYKRHSLSQKYTLRWTQKLKKSERHGTTPEEFPSKKKGT